MVGTKFNNLLVGGLLLGLALMLIVTSPALAAKTKWKATVPGNWNELANWTNGVPAKEDDAIIDTQGADVTYLNSSNPTLNFLRLGLVPIEPLIDPDSWRVTLTQTQDILTVKNAEIGSKGTAEYIQFGGSHKILHDLTLGTAKDGEGNYSILWGGSLSVGGHETLGLAGAGYLSQLGNSTSLGTPPPLECAPPPVTPPQPVGPTHLVGKNLSLGVESEAYGQVDLSKSSLTVGGSIRVGIKGTGIFDQDKSIVKIKGNETDPLTNEGTLSSSPLFSALSKKNLKNNKLECVSSRQPGLIVGLENVDIEATDPDKEGIDNFGQYNLKGGTLNVNYSEIIGLDAGGEGYFSQSDGAHTINGNLYLGKEIGSYGDFLLSVTTPENPDTSVGLLDVHGFASVGYLGEGNFLQTGGTVKIRGIDQEVNLGGKSLSTTLSKGTSLSCTTHQYIGFTVGRGGTGLYSMNDGELLVSRGEVIGMVSGSNGAFEQIGGSHFIGGNLTLARDQGSNGIYTLNGGTLKVQGSLLNNESGTFDYYGGELLANVINKGKFTAHGTGTRTFPKQFFNYGTFTLTSESLGTAAFAQKFRNYNAYKSTGNPGVDNRFTYLYIAPQGYIEAGATDNYYVTKEFTNTSTKKAEWKTETANLIFSGPGRKPFKTGSANLGEPEPGSTGNFAWRSLEIAEGSVQLLDVLYAQEIRGIKVKNPLNKKITNLFGTCSTRIYYDTISFDPPNLNEYILTNIYGRQVGRFTADGYVPDCN